MALPVAPIQPIQWATTSFAEVTTMLHPQIVEHLTADDDLAYWDIAAATLLNEAEARAAQAKQDVYAEIGCCRHWISPHHPLRWYVGGEFFAWPFGYNKTVSGHEYCALPEFTWSESLKWTGEAWELGRTGERRLVFRIAIPARTMRHLRASIHTIWTPNAPNTKDKSIELFGFRKRNGIWTLTAREILRRRHARWR